MKLNKNSKFYLIVWAMLFVLFNIIAFVSVGWTGVEKYTASFWIGYVFITLSLIGQLFCALSALKEDNLQKLFYNISLIKTSYTGLIVSFVFGGLCMLISPLPYWIGALVCAIVLFFNLLALAKAKLAVETVSEIDSKIKAQTFFIKSLTADAESLLSCAKSDAAKAACKKVYEAARYSDPMSNEMLRPFEAKIAAKFEELTQLVKAEQEDGLIAATEEILILIKERNSKCKLMK